MAGIPRARAQVMVFTARTIGRPAAGWKGLP